MPLPISKLRAKLEILGVTVPMALMRRLSFDSAFRLGERLGEVAYVVARPQRRVAAINLKIAFPEKAEAERQTILRESCRNLGRMVAEFCRFQDLTPENIAERVTFSDPEDWRQLREEKVRKNGALILTGHFGNWELFHIAVGLYGTSVHVIQRPFRNPAFGELVDRERSRAGTVLLSKREAARPTIRALRDERMVVVPFDQNATGRWGVFADFFSVPASTHPGLARFAMMSGAPVVPAFLVRQGGSPRHQVHFLPDVEVVSSDDREADVVENTRRFNRVFEDMVRRHPDHWIWMHKRWRTRPSGEPPIY